MSKEIRLTRIHELLVRACKDDLLCGGGSVIPRVALDLIVALKGNILSLKTRSELIDAYPAIMEELTASVRSTGIGIKVFRPVDDRGDRTAIAFIRNTTLGNNGFSIIFETADPADIRLSRRIAITAYQLGGANSVIVDGHEEGSEHFKFAFDALKKIIPDESELLSDKAVASARFYNLYDMGKYLNTWRKADGLDASEDACATVAASLAEAAEFLGAAAPQRLCMRAKNVAWNNVEAELLSSESRDGSAFKFIHPASDKNATVFFNLSRFTVTKAVEVLIELSPAKDVYVRMLVSAITLGDTDLLREVVVYDEDSDEFRGALTRLPKDLGIRGQVVLSLNNPPKAEPVPAAAPAEASSDEGSSFSERYAANNSDLEVPAFEGKGPEERVAELLGNRDDIYETRLNYMPGTLVAHLQHARALYDDAIGRLALSPRYLEPMDLHNVTELVREEAVLRFHFDKLRAVAQERSTVRGYEDILSEFMENYAEIVFAASAIANIIRVATPAAEKLASVNSVFMPRH